MNHFYDLVKSQILIIFLFGSVTWAENDNRRTPIVKAVERVGASVVNINTEEVAPAVRNPFRDSRNPFFDHFFKEFFPSRDNNRRSLGSGVIIHPEGYILTNEHVVSKATIIKVTLIDKREFDARLVGADIKSDLAVIKIETNENLPHISLGRSDDLMIGETVIAIGNPFGLQHTVTTGIISALHRSIKGGENRVYRGFIQLDASINPGNSGGPLLNIEGSLIGINTAIFKQAEGIGFAIPINKAKRIINDLIRYGKVRRGWLGVSVQSITKEMLSFFNIERVRGVVVTRIMERSPGARAGLKRGDVILSLENIEVNDKTDYSERVSTYPLGNTINMGILRGGKVESVSLKVSLLPASRVADYVKIWLGFTVNKIQQSLVRRYRLVTSQGVVVTSVTPNSVSDKIGVQSGDIIRQVNQVKIENEKDFRAAMVEVAGRDSVLILVQRGQNGYYVTLEP
ncbi:MAG: Do family serine endopeptidase [Nitrospina sp.]|jgi:serine protease Do|nr:Do family serine endopeptidase [Nitrospina sp.]MBT7272950.1 Do family serine endopeptidase [Nitrospina sp.]|tara:strand:+ start:5282 stop:6652 length:1371 start_codon:yes stop_codon:yes gene_type:complete